MPDERASYISVEFYSDDPQEPFICESEPIHLPHGATRCRIAYMHRDNALSGDEIADVELGTAGA